MKIKLADTLKLTITIIINYWFMLAAGCSQNGASITSFQAQVPTQQANSVVAIANISVIPSSANANDYAILTITNNSTQDVKLVQTNIIQNGITISNNLASIIDSKNCSNIAALDTCKLNIYANQPNGGYLIHMYFNDDNGNIYLATQLIRFNDALPADNNGMIYSSRNVMITSKTGIVSLPIRLAKDFTNVSFNLMGNIAGVTCPNGYSIGNLCTAFIVNSNQVSSTNMQKGTIRIVNKSSNELVNSVADTSSFLYITSFSSSSQANLITSAVNAVVSPSNTTSPVLVTIYNNGVGQASNIKISNVIPILIESNTCTSTLSASSSCTFYVDVNNAISGQSSVTITYNDTKYTQQLAFGVVYISFVSTPLLTLTLSGNFTNVVENSNPKNIYITVTNSGNIALNNLLYSDINLQVATMSSNALGTSCVLGQSLHIGSSCVVALSFNPATLISGSINFIANSTYFNQAGQIQSYANSNLSIPYSSVTGAVFRAVGDFGMVITSPAGAAGTWTANIDSPFATTAQSATGMTKMGSTYAISRSDGSVKYSTLNGLFWQSANTTKMNTNNTCGITNDGTAFYTCGRVSVAYSSVCTTTNRYCIIKSSALTGAWTPLYQATNTNAMNGIYYKTNGSQSAYVVTNAAGGTAANSFITSTNGSTFALTSSGQSTGGNKNNFSSVAYNSITGNLVAWDSVGFSSSQLITLLGTAWTPSTLRPANTIITGATFTTSSSTYLVTGANNIIYSTTNPASAGSYTTVQPSVGQQLNDIASNSAGPNYFLAVGNAGKTAYSNSTIGAIGSWTQATVTIGQATAPNFSSSFIDTATAIWAVGVSAIIKSIDSAVTWFTPGIVSITKNGSNYLAVDNQGFIYSSSNLTTWIQQTNPTSNVLNAVYCAATNLCFAVGQNGTILKTTNGTTWSQLTSGTSTNLKSIFCNIVANQCVIVGGTGSAGSGTVLTSSSDYTTWSIAASTLATTSLNSVTYSFNQYVAVGNAGTVFTSTNGTNWQTRTSGTANNLNAVLCGPEGCVAGGNTGTIIFSVDGSVWSTSTSATTNDILSVAYNGSFVVVAKGGVIRFSTVGTGTWTAATFPTTSSTTNNLSCVISD